MATTQGLPGNALNIENRPKIAQTSRSSAAQTSSVVDSDAANRRQTFALQTGTGTHTTVTKPRAIGVQKPKSVQRSQIENAKRVSKARPSTVDDDKVLEWLGAVKPLADSKTAAADITTESPTTESTRLTPKQAVPHSVSDHVVLRRVGDRLVERGIPSFNQVRLEIKSGVLTVCGEVASKPERLLLIQILQSTPGVHKVHDGLKIRRSGSKSLKIEGLFAAIPAFNDMLDPIKAAFFGLKPVPATVAVVVLGLMAVLFWPRATSRPFAVYPLKGRVVLDGQPLPKATVVLHPLDQGVKTKFPSGKLPRATSREDGEFAVGTFEESDGAPTGEFVATVFLIESIREGDEWVHKPNQLPELYAHPETSPLKVKVTRETKEISLLELHKNDGAPPVIH